MVKNIIENNGNGESKIRKVIFNEVSLIIALVGVVSSIIFWVVNPQRDNNVAIQLQEQRISAQELIINKLTETQQNDIKEVKTEIVGLRSEVQDLRVGIKALEVIINERIPARK